MASLSLFILASISVSIAFTQYGLETDLHEASQMTYLFCMPAAKTAVTTGREEKRGRGLGGSLKGRGRRTASTREGS